MKMKTVVYRTVVRILVVAGMALALMILALGTFVAAAKSVQTSSEAFRLQRQPTFLSVIIGLPPGDLPPEQEVITPTPTVSTPGPFTLLGLLPSQQLPDVLPTAEEDVNEPSLPEWVLDLTRAGNLQTSSSDISVVKLVTTSQTRGAAGQSIVLNGEVITYTIIITNLSMSTLTNISVTDELPRDTLTEVKCTPGDICGVFYEPQQFDTIFGPYTIMIPRTVTGFIDLLEPGRARQLVFSGTVVCQPDGATFNNRAVVIYKKGDEFKAVASNETQTAVRVDPQPGGDFSLSNSSSWCSNELGGFWDLDWGDFDRDGDLDLALGSEAGTAVYRNENGNLLRFQLNAQLTNAVRWADVDSDGFSELLALSENAPNTENFSGHIYNWDGSEFIASATPFTTMHRAFRLAPVNYDSDDAIELAVISWDHSSCGLFFFQNNGTGNLIPDSNNSSCLVDSSVRAIAWGDYDNDGDSDLAVGGFSGDRVFTNIGGIFSLANSILLDNGEIFDLAWGDYDSDGDLDLVAGTNNGQVRIYPNAGGSFTAPIIVTVDYFVGFAADWGDFSGDGKLELAAADTHSRILEYGNGDFSSIITLPRISDQNLLLRIRGADQDNDGDLDLTIGNLLGQSVLFTNFAPFLTRNLLEIKPPNSYNTMPASSVAWGDAVGSAGGSDGKLDLLFGAGPAGPGELSFLQSKLYQNVDGNFPITNVTQLGLVGPHYVAFGDVNGDGKLDIALATPNQGEIYLNGNTASAAWRSTTSLNSQSLAFADVDLDNQGRLDLLFGNPGPETLFLNAGLQLPTSAPDWSSTENDDTRSVAWGYLDDDLFPDFAAGNYGQPNRVYRNNGGKSFTLVDWNPAFSDDPTRSVAWGDYDLDGDMDLAVGNYGRPNRIYENQGGILSNSPVWTAPVTSNTTSLAWGDWNNDGRPDLAVGNHGERDQVYANLRGPGGLPNLVWLWESAEAYDTTGVAWGDMDNDGDLDLAISQDGDGQSGVYENTYVLAAHLVDNFVVDMPLPQNPSYVAVARPGNTDAAYFFSSAEVFSITKPLAPPTTTFEITIPFRVYDPDGTRDTSFTNAQGDRIAKVEYHFSLDGGTTWETATPATGGSYTNITRRLGQPGTFVWDAGKDLNDLDEVVSDDVRFRVTVVHGNKTGPTQRAMTSGVSPPFRVRRLECVWPDNASIAVKTPIAPGVPTVFTGTVSEAQGQVVFNWDFGDHMPAQGQIVQHTYGNGRYVVTLSVLGPACPVAREAVAIINVTVGTGIADIYLPLILKSSSGGRAAGVTPEPPGPTPEPGVILFALDNSPGAPSQVGDLSGDTRLNAGVTSLTWSPNPPEDGVLGYRVYRSQVEVPAFRLLAELPAGVTNYTDDTAACGQMTFVTAYNAAGESLPSTASYFSPPCR